MSVLKSELNNEQLLNEYKLNIKKHKNEDKIEEEYCTICDSYDIINIDGYITCKLCGNQITNIIDSGQEWRYYGQFDNKTNDPARCGIPTNELMPNASMGSIISTSWNDTYGIRRIRKIHTWNSISYKESTLLKSFNNITVVSNNNDINNCICEEAKHMFKKVTEIKSYRKAKKNAMEAASLQLACKLRGVSRDSSEIAQMFGISLKDMRKGTKQFEELWITLRLRDKKLSYKLEDDQEDDQEDNQEFQEELSFKPSDSIVYLHRSCSKLNLSDDIFEICKSICMYIEETKMLIKHIPLSRTAGCIYFTCYILNINIDKQNISAVCLVSEVTINKCFQKLLKNKENIIKNTKAIEYIQM